MSEKQPTIISPKNVVMKRPRKAITLEVKADIIKRFEQGESVAQISRVQGMASSTVTSIIKNASKIKEISKFVSISSATRLTRTRDSVMQNMERLLCVWIDDQVKRNMPLSMAIIQEKARNLFTNLKKSQSKDDPKSPETFNASQGWFMRFKRRVNLQNLKFANEAAEEFPAKLRQMIQEGGYSSKQVFTLGETKLFWKKLPSRTFVAQEEINEAGFKSSNDFLSLLLGGNAEGDVKLKPLLVFHTENPRALQGFLKPQLPVIWRSNADVLVTGALMQDYVINYFSNFIEKYSRDNNLDNRALLLVDNTPAHPSGMEDWCENIKVVFLPPNTTSLLSPMDQGVISSFKAHYLRCLMHQLLKETDGEGKLSVREFWKFYNIKKCIENIKEAWDELSVSTMNSVWVKFWPECVYDFTNADDYSKIIKQIVEMAIQVGFDQVDEENVIDLLESNTDLVSYENPTGLDHSREEEMEDCSNEIPVKQLTFETLGAIMGLFEQAVDCIIEQDPNLERSTNVSRAVNKAITCYKELYAEKKKNRFIQPTFHSFFISNNAVLPSTSHNIQHSGVLDDKIENAEL